MIELGVLARDMHGLKELSRVAWKDLANPLLTPLGRREARNQIDQYSIELRRHLQPIEAERSRSEYNPLRTTTVAALASRSFGFSPAAYRAGLERRKRFQGRVGDRPRRRSTA
jgi:hypothetical protein